MSNNRIRRKRDKKAFARIMASGCSWSYQTTTTKMPQVTIESLLKLQRKLRQAMLDDISDRYILPARFFDSGPVMIDQRILITTTTD